MALWVTAVASMIRLLNDLKAPDRAGSSTKPHHKRMPKVAPNPLRDIVRAIYPFRSTLLSMLSCRDVALLMAVLGLPLHKEENRRYFNIIRGMPEHQAWIYAKLHEGFTVTLIGKDVRELCLRMQAPLHYRDAHRGREDLTIWIAVLPGPNTRSSVPKGRRLGMSMYGRVTQPDLESPRERVIGFREIMTTLFVPLPGNTATYYRDGLDWYECLTPNE